MVKKKETIEEEIKNLKGSLSYRDFGADTDMLLDDLDRQIFSVEHRKGKAIYWIASELALEAYYEKGMLEPLVNMYKKHKFNKANFFEELMEHLLENKRTDLIVALWASVVQNSIYEFLYQRPRREVGQLAEVEVFKNRALESYDVYIGYMEQIGEKDRIPALKEDRARFDREEFQVVTKTIDKRKIDELVFWQLLDEVKNDSQSITEQVVKLGEHLQNFAPADIKRFQSIYCKLMKKLYHWNVWALAYAARDGCSDNSFEAFRTWLILNGDAELLETAVSDPALAANKVSKEPDLPDGS